MPRYQIAGSVTRMNTAEGPCWIIGVASPARERGGNNDDFALEMCLQKDVIDRC